MKSYQLLVMVPLLFSGCESISERNARLDQERQDAYNKQFPPALQKAEKRGNLQEQIKTDKTSCGRLAAYKTLVADFHDDPDIKSWQTGLSRSENEVIKSLKAITASCKRLCAYDDQYEENIELLDRISENCSTDRVAKEVENSKAAMTGLFDKLKRPVGVLRHYYENSGYTLQTVAVFRNNTTKDIEAFEYAWSCKDAYGRGSIESYMWQQAIDGEQFGPGGTVTVTRDSFRCRDTVDSFVLPYSFKPVDGPVKKIK